MKNLLFGLIATVLFSLNGNAQTSNQEWLDMMETYKSLVESEISKECPKEFDLQDFKKSLINGENKLSETAEKTILTYAEPLIKYGLEFAKKNNLKELEVSDLIFYSSISPKVIVENGEIITAKVGEPGLTMSEVFHCAINALGGDALYSLAFSGATSWTAAALTTTFTGVAKRFLGPLGVAIAVVTFGICIAGAV
ncbi:hypothetical protein [Flavobacterium sp.]|uniref:hypothetical protein n=1 Tax=Flavobacterium sp. TaxID=239 RepID=UPI00375280F3